MVSSRRVPYHPALSDCHELIEPPPAEPAGRRDAAGTNWDARLWGALVVLCGVLFLDGLDVSMVGVALPSIRDDLGLSPSQLQWVVSGYVLGYGGLLLLGGRTADLLGRRRTLLGALAVFLVASAVGATVSDGTLIVVTRFLKGASAAFTAPASLSTITTTFPEGPARNRALSIYTACGASGFSLGLVLGGLLTEAGWRFTFLLPVPIAAAILIALPRVLPDDTPDPGQRRSYDFPGAVTITAGMLLLVRTVVRAPSIGWGSAETLISFAVAVALLVAFVTIELNTREPLVRLGILKSGPLARANLTAMVVFGCYVSFQFVGTLYLQALLGWSPISTALAFLPGGLIVAFGSPNVGPLADRFGTERVIAVGLVAFVIGYALILRIQDTLTYATVFLPTMILIGIGFALCFPMLNIQATAGIANEEQGVASGLVQTSFQVGGAIVLAVITAIVSTQATGSPSEIVDGYRTALEVVLAVSAAGLAVMVFGLFADRRAALEVSAEVESP
jgi:EmrB/QacA subfamily drug resistance transporter